MYTMANTQLQFHLMSVCILVTQMTNGAYGVITGYPLNRVVYEGAINTTITCESTSPLSWILTPFIGSEFFHNGMIPLDSQGVIKPNFNEWFAIDHSQGTEVYTLVVLNATIAPPDGSTFSTAGHYICLGSEGEQDYSYYAHLVVIRTDPICSSNFTQSTATLQSGDVIQLSCTIVYGAEREWPIDAVMTWSVNGQPIPATDSTFTIVSSPTEVTASSTLLISDNFDATYECRTTFSPPSITGAGLASNAPDYCKTCTIPPEAASTTTCTQDPLIPCSSSTSHSDQCVSNLMNIAVYEGQLNTRMDLLTDPQSVTWRVLPTTDELFLQTIIDVGCNKDPSVAQLYDAYQTGLLIKNATTIGDPISTAGLYVGQCGYNQELTGAKLLVVRSGPQCSSISVDSTSSSITCSVTFADSALHPIYPIITWRLNGNYLESYTLQRDIIDWPVYFASSTITTNSGTHVEDYQCELTFDAPTEIQYDWIATNAPTFKESCSASPQQDG